MVDKALGICIINGASRRLLVAPCVQPFSLLLIFVNLTDGGAEVLVTFAVKRARWCGRTIQSCSDGGVGNRHKVRAARNRCCQIASGLAA